MRCEDVRGRVEEIRLDLLDRGSRAAVQEHLAGCAACGREYAEAVAFETVLDAARDDGARDDELRHAIATDLHRRRWWRATLIGGLAAAALLVAFVVQAATDGPARLRVGANTQLSAAAVAELGQTHVTALVDEVELSAISEHVVELRRGSARFHVTPGHGPFTVRTPAGRIEVKGTEFEVSVMRNKPAVLGGVVVTAVVLTGVVVMANRHGEESVEAGEVAVATAETAPQLYSAERVEGIERENRRLAREVERLRGELDEARRGRAQPSTAGAAAAAGEPTDESAGSVLESMDWAQLGADVAALVAGESVPEESREDQTLRAMQVLSTLQQLRKELGLDDIRDLFFEPRVVRPFFAATLAAALPDLPDVKRTRILDAVQTSAVSWAASAHEPLLPIDRRLRDLQTAVDILDRLKGELTPEERRVVRAVLIVERPGTSNSTWVMQSGYPNIAEAVPKSYVRRYELGEDDAQAAREVLAELIDAQLARIAELETTLPRTTVLAAINCEDPEVAIAAERERGGRGTAAERYEEDHLRVRAAVVAVQAKYERKLHERVSAAARQRLRARECTLMFLQVAGD